LGAAILPRLAAEPIPAEVKVCSFLEFRLSRLKSVIAVRLGNSSQERQW